MSHRTSSYPSRRSFRHPWLVAFIFVACFPGPRPGFAVGEQSACSPLEITPAGSTSITPGCGCLNGSGTVADTGDWGKGIGSGAVTTRALPGRLCHMNVGNTGSGDGYKIDTCSNLQGRAAEISGQDCDTISVVELMSDSQCSRICGTDPLGEKCLVCKGCGFGAGATYCAKQASVVCPSSQYDVVCTQAPPPPPSTNVGCDCICRKKDVCAAQGPSCTSVSVRVASLSWWDTQGRLHPCNEGNHATCTRCTDPNGGPSTGNCVVHPDHCNIDYDSYSFPTSNDAVNRARCLAVCSTGLLNGAAAAIAGMDIRTLQGDFNCTPRGGYCNGGGVSIEECPWLSSTNTFAGMKVCTQTANTASVGLIGMVWPTNCMLDFVLSNSCGCGVTEALSGIAYGDHRTILFGRLNQPFVEYIVGSGHRLVHGTRTVELSGGMTSPTSYSVDSYGPYGLDCVAAATCGYSQTYGKVVAHTEACESRHEARIRQPAGCSVPVKALVCEKAGAWGWASGQASGHGAETADTAGASATATGGAWQAACDKRRKVVDLLWLSSTEVASSPLLFLANADASCTLRPPAQGTPKPGGTLTE